MQRERTAIKAAGRAAGGAAAAARRRRARARPWSSCTRAWARSRCGGTSRPGCASASACPAWSTTAGAMGSPSRLDRAARPPLPARRGASCSCRRCSSRPGCAADPDRPQRRRHDRAAVRGALPRPAGGGRDRGRARLRRGDHARRHPGRGRAYAETDLATRLARYHGDKTERLFRAWHDRWLSPEFRAWNIEAELPRVICPVLVLQGEADEYGTPAQVTAIARAVSGPAETVMLPGVGHTPHHQAADRVLELIADFVGRQLAAARAAPPAPRPGPGSVRGSAGSSCPCGSGRARTFGSADGTRAGCRAG